MVKLDENECCPLYDLSRYAYDICVELGWKYTIIE